MKTRLLLVASILAVLALTVPAYAGPNKEMLQLQLQVQQLLKMQQSIDEKMGVLQDRLNTLTQQVTESLKQISASADKVDKALQQQAATSDSCVDQIAGQAQPIHDSLTELRAQVAAMSKQLSEVNGTRQNVPAQSSEQEDEGGIAARSK